MTLGTMLEAATGARSETRVPPAESRPTADRTLERSPRRAGRVCPRVAALPRCQVRRPRRPCTAQTGFSAVRLARCAFLASADLSAGLPHMPN